jgi:hypothetical protein
VIESGSVGVGICFWKSDCLEVDESKKNYETTSENIENPLKAFETFENILKFFETLKFS